MESVGLKDFGEYLGGILFQTIRRVQQQSELLQIPILTCRIQLIPHMASIQDLNSQPLIITRYDNVKLFVWSLVNSFESSSRRSGSGDCTSFCDYEQSAHQHTSANELGLRVQEGRKGP